MSLNYIRRNIRLVDKWFEGLTEGQGIGIPEDGRGVEKRLCGVEDVGGFFHLVLER